MRALHPADEEEEATYKILAGTLFSALCGSAEGWPAWRLAGGWVRGVLLAGLVPTGFLALGRRERTGRITREARAFLRFVVDRDLRRYSAAGRRALRAELGALASLVEAEGTAPDAHRI